MDQEANHPIRVLLLEDSALDAELIEAQLRSARLDVAVDRVWTRAAFVEALHAGGHDVILSDHMLPNFDGDAALGIAQQHAADTPFIFVSGTLTEELAVQALTRGARDYVVKQRLQRLPEAVVRSLRENEERKRLREAEDELQRSRDTLQLIADALPALIGHLGADHRYRFGNHAHADWFGLAPRDLVGRHARDVFGEAWFNDALPSLEEVLRGGRTTFEARLPGGHGLADRYVQVDCVAETDSHGRVGGYYLLARDISGLKRAELELQQVNGSLARLVHDRTVELQGSESRLKEIFESSFQHQVLLSPAGVVLDANMASLSSVLRAKGDVFGTFFWDAVWFSDSPDARDVIRALVESASRGESARHELELALPTGIRSFDFSLRPLRDPAGSITGIVSEAVETTARRAAEHALRQSQKIEAVGQLTGGIAHDFNNILTIITGNIEVAKLSVEAPGMAERSVRVLDNALKAVSSAASLTQRLLAFSRKQPLKAEVFDPKQRLDGMRDMLQRTLGELVHLRIDVDPDVWGIEADAAQLEASVLNLAVNARDAMPEGGELLLEVANVHLDDEQVARMPDLTPGDFVMLRMTDSGAGMPAETVARVFEPFFTTKEVGRGTGLGLPMVYGFVKQSGGDLFLESTPGIGTMITLFFPRSTQALPQALASDVTEKDGAARDATILVAEDNDDVRAYVVEALRGLGFRVLEAHDGPSALRLLERREAAVDLLFSDVVMPGMSGWELAERAKALSSELKVLFTSGYPRDLQAHESTMRGVGILAKPFTRAGLAAAIDQALLTGNASMRTRRSASDSSATE